MPQRVRRDIIAKARPGSGLVKGRPHALDRLAVPLHHVARDAASHSLNQVGPKRLRDGHDRPPLVGLCLPGHVEVDAVASEINAVDCQLQNRRRPLQRVQRQHHEQPQVRLGAFL